MDAQSLRRIKILDGLHYSFRLIAHHQEGMYGHCCRIASDSNQVVPALACCWGFIDALHRIRELTQAVPGLSRRHIEVRRFLDATKLAEQYRHYIQHLRGELSKGEPNPYPVWGSVSWVSPTDGTTSHTVMIGAQLPGTGYSGAVYDTVEKRWVSRVSLGIAGSSFNFDVLYAAAERFESFILPWMQQQEGERVKVTDRLPIVSAQIVIKENAQPGKAGTKKG